MASDSIRRIIARGALLTALASVVLAGCTPDPERATPASIEMGLSGTPDALDLPYFIAADLGYFEEEGLRVRYRPLPGDTAAIQALLSRSVDVTSAGFTSVAKARARGADIRIVTAVAQSHDYVLVGHKDVKSVADVKGRTVGIFAPGDITETLAKAYLRRNQISAADVTWVSVGGSSERLKALAAGRIDATLLHSDDALVATKTETLREISNVAREMPMPMSAVAVQAKTLTSNRDTVEKLVRALRRAAATAQQDANTFVSVGQRYLEGLSEEQLRTLHGELVEAGVFADGPALTRKSVTNAFAVMAVADEGAPLSDPAALVEFPLAELIPAQKRSPSQK